MFYKSIKLKTLITRTFLTLMLCVALSFTTFALPTAKALPDSEKKIANSSNTSNKKVFKELKASESPSLTSINIDLEENKNITISYQGTNLINNENIKSFNLTFSTIINPDLRYYVSFAPATVDQNLNNTDSTVAPVCKINFTDPSLQDCVYTIKADGSNLDNTTKLSNPSPRASFKALPKRSYEVNFSYTSTDDTPIHTSLNSNIPAFINITPKKIKAPDFSDTKKLGQARQDAINGIAAINITVGSDCKVGKVTKKCYSPANTVNRGAMAEFMRSTLGKPETTKKIPNITDIKKLGKSRQQAIEWLAAEKVTTLSGTKYNPANPVNRGAMAEFLWNLAGKPTVSDSIIAKAKSILTGDYKTIDKLSKNRSKAVYWMVYNKISVGSTINKKVYYSPANPVNRGAMAEFLWKFYNMIHYNNPYGKMLMVQTDDATFLNTGWSRANINSITFTKDPAVDFNNVPADKACFDVSALQDKSVSACSLSFDQGKDITISASGGVRANVNSSYLFSGLTSITKIDGFVKSDGNEDAFTGTQYIDNMSYMFSMTLAISSRIPHDFPANFRLPAGIGSSATNMGETFAGSNLPAGLTFPAGFGSKATNMKEMFYMSILPSDLKTFPAGFGAKATNMESIFCRSTFPDTFTSFPDGFGSEALIMRYAFGKDSDSAVIYQMMPKNLTTFPAGFGAKATDMFKMFSKVSSGGGDWPSKLLTFPAGFGQNATNMANMFQVVNLPDNLKFPTGFGSKAIDMGAMFYVCSLPKNLTTFPAGFGAKATNMNTMFCRTTFPDTFTSFPASFGSEAGDMGYMFGKDIESADIYQMMPQNLTSFPDGFGAKATKMKRMFSKVSDNGGDWPSKLLTFPAGFGQNATDMERAFFQTNLPDGLTFPAGFGQNGDDMTEMFSGGRLPQDLTSFPAGFGSNASTMTEMFNSVTILGDIFPTGFGQNADVMTGMFSAATLTDNVHEFPAGFGSKARNMGAMFFSASLSANMLTFPQGFGQSATNIGSMFFSSRAHFPAGFIFPAYFASNSNTFTQVFRDATLDGDIYFDRTFALLPTLAANTDAFTDTNFNGHVIYVHNPTIKSKLVSFGGNADENNIVVSLALKTELANGKFLGTNWQRNAIKTIAFSKDPAEDIDNPPSGTVCYDVSIDDSKRISACSPDDGLTITVSSDGGVRANTNSENLFRDLTSIEHIINFVSANGQEDALIGTDKIIGLSNSFTNSTLPSDFKLPAGFGSNAIGMSQMFLQATFLTNSQVFPAGFGSKAINMTQMFKSAVFSNATNFTFPAGFGSIAECISYMFNGTQLPPTLTSLNADLGSKATDLQYMFASAKGFNANFTFSAKLGSVANSNMQGFFTLVVDAPANLTSFPAGFGSKATNMSFMFEGSNFSNLTSFPAGFGSEAIYMGNMFSQVSPTDQSTWCIFPPLLRTFPAGFGAKATDMGNMFDYTAFADAFVFPDHFGEAAKYMQSMFNNTKLPANLTTFPAGFGQNAIDTNYMFYQAQFNDKFTSFPAGFGSKTTNVVYMFHMRTSTQSTDSPAYPAKFPQGLKTFPAGFASVVTSGDNMFLASSFADGFNLNSDFGLKMTKLHLTFSYMQIPSSFKMPAHLGADGCIDLSSTFEFSTLPDGFTFPANFGKDATTIASIFWHANLPDSLTSLPQYFGTKAQDMTQVFADCKMPSGLTVFPYNFGVMAIKMISAFERAKFSTDIDWITPTTLNVALSDANIAGMFTDTEFNGFGLYVGNATIQNKYAREAITGNQGLKANIRLHAALEAEPSLTPTNFLSTSWPRSDIKNLTFTKDPATDPDNAPSGLVCFDVSNDHSKSVSACSADTGLSVTISQAGGVVANYDSSSLFSSLSALESLDGFVSNSGEEDAFIATNKIVNMNRMFLNMNIPSAITALPNGFGTNATFMQQTFEGCDFHSISAFPAGFGSNATDMSNMFSQISAHQRPAVFGSNFTAFPAGFGSKATDLSYFMDGVATLPADFTFPAGFGSEATTMLGAFAGVTLPANMKTFPAGFGSKATSMKMMFYTSTGASGQYDNPTTLPADFTFPAGFGSEVINVEQMFKETKISEGITFPAGFGSKINSASEMFSYSTLPSSLKAFPAGFGSVAGNMLSMFAYAEFKNPDFAFPAGFGKTVNNMGSMFRGASMPANLTAFPGGFGSNVGVSTNGMSWMFADTTLPSGLTSFPVGFGAKAQLFSSMFQNCVLPVNFKGFPAGFGSAATNMSGFFQFSTLPAGLTEFPANFGKSASNLIDMFKDATLTTDIDWTGLTASPFTPTVTTMFENTDFGENVIFVYNEAIQSRLVSAGGNATTSNIVVRSVLKAENDTDTDFLDTLWPRADIKKITFTKNPATVNPAPAGMVCKDVSNTGTKSISACSPEGANVGQEITISAPGGVIANSDSKSLFRGMRSLTTIDGFVSDNGTEDAFIGLSKITNYDGIFKDAKIPTNINAFPATFGVNATTMIASFNGVTWSNKITQLPIGFGSKATDMGLSFANITTFPANFSFPNGFGLKAISMAFMFTVTKLPSNLTSFPAGFGSVAENMSNMFFQATLPANMQDFPVGFGSVATNMTGMFSLADVPAAMYALPDGFGSKATKMESMFNTAKFLNKYFEFPANFGSIANTMYSLFYNAELPTDFTTFPSGFGSKATDMQSMFFGVKFPAGLTTFPAGFGSNTNNATNMFQEAIFTDGFTFPNEFLAKAGNFEGTFRKATMPANLTSLPDGFGSNATSLSQIFYNAIMPSGLVAFPAGFGVNAENMYRVFCETRNLHISSLPAGFGSNATIIADMFGGNLGIETKLNSNIDWTNTISLKSGVNASNMFRNTDFNGHVIYVDNTDIQAKFISDSTGTATNQNIVVRLALKAETANPTTFLSTPWPRSAISKITFADNTASVIDNNRCYDVSNDGSSRISACSDNGTQITISSVGGVKANLNSSYLFSNLAGILQINGFVNSQGAEDAFVDANEIVNMTSMFANSTIGSTNLTSLPDGFGSKATDMGWMFRRATLPNGLVSFPAGFGSVATDMSDMFAGVTLPNGLVSFPDGFGSVATDMSDTFADASLPNGLVSFPAGFGSVATDMGGMFYQATLPNGLVSFPAGFGSVATDMGWMFDGVTLPNGLVSFPAGFGSVATDMGGMFYQATLPNGLVSFPAGFGSVATDMGDMFYAATLQTNIDWSQTTFTKLPTMEVSNMFSYTYFNSHKIKVINAATQTKFTTSTGANTSQIVLSF